MTQSTAVKRIPRGIWVLICVTVFMLAGCDVWRGDEFVYVKLDEETVAVQLRGLPTCEVKGRATVGLVTAVLEAELVDNPEDYFYNFIASDGYSLRALLVNEKRNTGLPPWQDMQKGYLYASETYELMTGWEADTIGGAYGGCYNAKHMHGGTIELLEEDVLLVDE
ncbi:MAG: hypothetical protein GY868_04270 [Deltaproteobacteria bacterium]|nr:hypothetical protein [Deltaproteobacteria bacterium]